MKLLCSPKFIYYFSHLRQMRFLLFYKLCALFKYRKQISEKKKNLQL